MRGTLMPLPVSSPAKKMPKTEDTSSPMMHSTTTTATAAPPPAVRAAVRFSRLSTAARTVLPTAAAARTVTLADASPDFRAFCAALFVWAASFAFWAVFWAARMAFLRISCLTWAGEKALGLSVLPGVMGRSAL